MWVIVDTTKTDEIANAIKQIITNSEKWKQYSKSGVMNIRKYYTWEAHAKIYVNEIKHAIESLETEKMKIAVPSDARISGNAPVLFLSTGTDSISVS